MSEVVPLLKFTPSAQDPEVLEAITVQRESLIAKLVEVALDTGGGARHQLLIGPRGIGKTHILSLVASRVRAEDADSVALAWLDEDPWGVSSYEKFLAAIIGRIAAERADAELEAKANTLHATRDDDGHQAEQVLRDAVGESRLVLLVENLDEIFRRIGPNGQERFRALIEDWQQMLVIATAPQLFEGVQLHESPFYGFFAITHLEELSLESAGELMRRVAELRKDQALVRFLATEVARRRLAAVEALAGGHPRIWLLLSGCVSIHAIDELVPLFLEALDDLTPYYQDRLRELGDQQQELVVLLSETGGALSNRELSERSGIAQNQVATILRQLTDRGYVRRAEVPEELAGGDARMSYWELREPLMRLCLDVKQARGKPLRMVVEFLRAWYGPKLLDELTALPPTAELANSYVSEALRTLKGVLPARDLFRGSPEEVLARAEAGLAVTPDRWELQFARASGLLMQKQFDKAQEAYEALLSRAETDDVKLMLELQLSVARKARGEKVDAGPLTESLVRLSQDSPESARAQELAAFGLTVLDDHERALEIFPSALRLAPENPRLLASYGETLNDVGRSEEALEVFEKAVALDPGEALAQAGLGVALLRLERFQEALTAFEKALDLDPHAGDCRRFKGTILNKLGRFEEALDVFSEGIELDPDDAKMHAGLGSALLELGRYEEALPAFARASELEPSINFLVVVQGFILEKLDRPDEALELFRRAVELEPTNAAAFIRQATILWKSDRLDEAREAVQRGVSLAPGKASHHFTASGISFARDENEKGLAQLGEALTLWSGKRVAPEVDPLLLCQILWEVGRGDERRKVIDRTLEAYGKADAAEDLGNGLVGSIAWLAAPDVDAETADAWVADWAKAEEVEDLQIPMKLLRTANAWKQDRDRSHLLALPPEQREILVGLLEPGRSESQRP